jgi:hypothetical protein
MKKPEPGSKPAEQPHSMGLKGFEIAGCFQLPALKDLNLMYMDGEVRELPYAKRNNRRVFSRLRLDYAVCFYLLAAQSPKHLLNLIFQLNGQFHIGYILYLQVVKFFRYNAPVFAVIILRGTSHHGKTTIGIPIHGNRWTGTHETGADPQRH